MTELKRCPFCGAEPPTVKVLHPLDISTSVTFGQEKAIEAWKKRYKED